MTEETLEQPGDELRRLLHDITSAKASEVTFMGKRVKLGWLHYEQEDKFTDIVLHEKDVKKRDAKLCAVLLLDSRWKLKLLYWWTWRKLCYWSDMTAVDVLTLLDEAKKKMTSDVCSLVTILATGMTNVMMTTRSEEAAATRAGRAGARDTR